MQTPVLLTTAAQAALIVAAAALLVAVLVHRYRRIDPRPIARDMLIDSVVDGMVVVDTRQRILDVNRAAARLLGQRRPHVLGRPAAELLPRELAAMLQSPVHLRSELQVRALGPQSWFEVDVMPLARRGRPAGHLLVARDIGERRLAQAALEESRRALQLANARLEEQSITDPLTGLKNRRFLFQRLAEEISRSHRSGDVLGLLVVDLDHFKRVNDTHGHPAGDEVLVDVAATLSSGVRDGDVVTRLGGEEFAVLATDSDKPGIVSLAERLRLAICRIRMARHADSTITLTASIGVAFADAQTGTVENLLAEADRRLYVAKRQGRNRVVAGDLQAAAGSAG